MQKIISMVDFVLECTKKSPLEPYEQVNETFINKVINYANFLKQPLEIWQFVPCKLVDGVCIVLEELIFTGRNFVEVTEYQQSKERCIFEGFKSKYDDIVSDSFIDIQFYFYKNGNVQIYITNNTIELPSVFKYSTIEDLVKHNLTLTKTAQKQIGL